MGPLGLSIVVVILPCIVVFLTSKSVGKTPPPVHCPALAGLARTNTPPPHTHPGSSHIGHHHAPPQPTPRPLPRPPADDGCRGAVSDITYNGAAKSAIYQNYGAGKLIFKVRDFWYDKISKFSLAS